MTEKLGRLSYSFMIKILLRIKNIINPSSKPTTPVVLHGKVRVHAFLLEAMIPFTLNLIYASLCLQAALTRHTPFLLSHSGFALSFSFDATWLAIGAPGDSGSIGATFIFRYNQSIASYVQHQPKLQAIDGRIQGEGTCFFTRTLDSFLFYRFPCIIRQVSCLLPLLSHSGWALSFSSDAVWLAVGAPGSESLNGATFIFRYDQATGFYLPVPAAMEKSCTVGFSGSLSGDGRWLALGDPYYKGAVGLTWIFHRDVFGYRPLGYPLSAPESSQQGTSLPLF